MTNPINASSTPLPQSSGATTTAAQQSQAAVERQPIAASGNNSPARDIAESRERVAQELSQATQDISQYIQTVSRSLQISVDGDLGTTVIRVLDTETEELVRQIPAEEAIAIARYIADQQAKVDSDGALPGILIDREG